MKVSRIKITHKKFKEFKNMYYYFYTKEELCYFLEKLSTLNFFIKEVRLQGKVDEPILNYIALKIKETNNSSKDIELIKRDIYA